MTRLEFIQHLKNLGTLQGIADEQIDAYLGFALNALGQYQMFRYRLVGIPTGDRRDGIYADVIPDEAVDVQGVFQTQTDIKLDFEVVLDSQTRDRQLWLKGVKLPSYIGITTYAGLVQDYSNLYDEYNYPGRQRRQAFGTYLYDKFDVSYTAVPTVEDANHIQEAAIKCYVEAQGYQYRAGLDENLSDIVDRGPSGESTTFRHSNKSTNYGKLAEGCMAEFKRLAVRPYLSVGSFGEIQKLWAPGEIS